MDAKQIHGYFIAENGQYGEIDFLDDLEWLYNFIECSCIDLVYRRIGDFYYLVIVDDCGALNGRRITALSHDFKPELCGTIIVTKLDKDGENYIDLNESEIKNLKINTILLNTDVISGLMLYNVERSFRRGVTD